MQTVEEIHKQSFIENIYQQTSILGVYYEVPQMWLY
jgi:hypothetical protein